METNNISCIGIFSQDMFSLDYSITNVRNVISLRNVTSVRKEQRTNQQSSTPPETIVRSPLKLSFTVTIQP